MLRFLTFLTAMLALAAGTVWADMLGRTDDGRQVVLHDDGTWSFVAPAPGPLPGTQPAGPAGTSPGVVTGPAVATGTGVKVATGTVPVPVPAPVSGPVQAGLEDVDVYQYAYRNWENANWGEWGSLTLGSNVTGVPQTNRRIYIKFDHAAVAQAVNRGAGVALQLTMGGTARGTVDALVYRVAGSWNEGNGTYHSGQTEPNAAPGEISWNSQPAIDTSQVWDSRTLKPGITSVAFDITDLVRAWVNGQYPNEGLVLIGRGEGQASYQYIFHATEGGRSMVAPQIVIVAPQSGPVSTPTTPTTTTTGGSTGIGPNLIINGSFESAIEATSQTAGIPGWTVTKGSVDVLGAYWQQVDGRLSVDLAGTPGVGAIAQDVPTDPGVRYRIGFMMAGNPTCEAPQKSMRIYIDEGQVWADFSFATDNTSLDRMGWTAQHYSFVATNPITRIRFESTGPNRNCGIAIDKVVMVRQ